MNTNNYECPKCHNIFPAANKFLHDVRCTEDRPVPLNQSRIDFLGLNENQNRAPIQHRPQPIITRRNRNNNYINPLNLRESVIDIPNTFNCWLCGQTLPENEREDHLLCHQIQEENESFQNENGQQQNRPQQNRQQQNMPQQNR